MQSYTETIPSEYKPTFKLEANDQGEYVLTVFFNGTCSNSKDADQNPTYYPRGETVSILRQNIEASIGYDGPGSDSELHKKYSKELQIGLGYGVDINVALALEELQRAKSELEKKGKKIARVNIAGWSRGAAAGIELASKMALDKQLQDLEVNIFAIDPVPGVSRSHKYNRVLSKNVKDAFIVYAKNEFSGFFNPVIPIAAPGSGTNVYYMLMPGHHSTMVGNPGWRMKETAKKYPQIEVNFPEPGIIIRWLAELFLKQHGTKLEKEIDYEGKPVTREILLKLFTSLHEAAKDKKYDPLENEAYIFKQLFRRSRKAIFGNDSWTNLRLSQVEVLVGDYNHSPEAFNRFHAYLLDPKNDPEKFFSRHDESLIPFDINDFDGNDDKIENEDKNEMPSGEENEMTDSQIVIDGLKTFGISLTDKEVKALEQEIITLAIEEKLAYEKTISELQDKVDKLEQQNGGLQKANSELKQQLEETKINVEKNIKKEEESTTILLGNIKTLIQEKRELSNENEQLKSIVQTKTDKELSALNKANEEDKAKYEKIVEQLTDSLEWLTKKDLFFVSQATQNAASKIMSSIQTNNKESYAAKLADLYECLLSQQSYLNNFSKLHFFRGNPKRSIANGLFGIKHAKIISDSQMTSIPFKQNLLLFSEIIKNETAWVARLSMPQFQNSKEICTELLAKINSIIENPLFETRQEHSFNAIYTLLKNAEAKENNSREIKKFLKILLNELDIASKEMGLPLNKVANLDKYFPQRPNLSIIPME